MSVLRFLVGPVVEAYKARQERKAMEHETETALHSKKLDAMREAQSAEIALSIAQVNTAGWKDDWFTYLLSVPLIMAFFPAGQALVAHAFATLEQMPLWYKAFLGSAVASSFGLHTVDRAWKWWHA